MRQVDFHKRITVGVQGKCVETTALELAIHQKIREVSGGRNYVRFHQQRLGPQDLCWNGSEFRFWVWDKPSYRLFVSNKKGVCIEVDYNAPKESIWEIFENYVKDVDLNIKVEDFQSYIIASDNYVWIFKSDKQSWGVDLEYAQFYPSEEEAKQDLYGDKALKTLSPAMWRSFSKSLHVISIGEYRRTKLVQRIMGS